MLATIIVREHHLDALLPQSETAQPPTAVLLDSANVWSQAVWNVAEELGPMLLTDEQVEKGLTLAKNPVFVCGVHRSGTTLVRDLLDGHPHLVVLPSEGTYFTNLEFKLKSLAEDARATYLGKEWLRRLANPVNQPPYWVLGRSSEADSPYVDFARYVMAWWKMAEHTNNAQWPHAVIMLSYACCTQNLSTKLWVDKTPTNERFLQRIWREMPAAKIVHVIRDPAATLVSRKKMQPSVNIRSALRELKTSFQTAIKQNSLHDPRFLLLRYEELCDIPDLTIGKIATFLDIDNSSVLYQTTVAGLPTQANSSFSKEAILGKILKIDQHRQQDVLSKKEHQLIAAYLGNLARKLDYPLAAIGYFRTLYLKLKYRLL